MILKILRRKKSFHLQKKREFFYLERKEKIENEVKIKHEWSLFP